MKEIKCLHCETWNKAVHTHCVHCGQSLDDGREAEAAQRKKTERNPIPVIEIGEEEPFIQKLWKRPVQWAQLIFLTILSIIASIASSTVH